MRGRAAAPKGTKSCRIQGTFVNPSVRPSVRPPGPLRPEICPERADFRPERADFRPERSWGADRQTDGRTDKQTKVPCVLQDFVPFGAAALPLIPIYNHAKQGNGYR